jgi:hypothetical protein
MGDGKFWGRNGCFQIPRGGITTATFSAYGRYSAFGLFGIIIGGGSLTLEFSAL